MERQDVGRDTVQLDRLAHEGVAVTMGQALPAPVLALVIAGPDHTVGVAISGAVQPSMVAAVARHAAAHVRQAGARAWICAPNGCPQLASVRDFFRPATRIS